MRRNSYPSDLSDAQWRRIAHWVPRPKSGGRPAKYPRREIVNAIFYITHNGCAWRSLPYRIVFPYFRLWQQGGTWDTIHAKLRERVRKKAGKTPKAVGRRSGQPDRQDN